MVESLKRFLAPCASLRLTVVLLAMSTFLVFAGTVAQIDRGIWTVVDDYFRCAFAWMELRIFFPRSWNVPGGFWFPGGWLLAGCLLVNVISAHLVRFKIKADGGRLVAGIALLGAGVVFTWLIIAGVFDQQIAATESAAFWRVLFRLAKGGGAAAVLMAGCILIFRRRAGIVLLHSGVILLIVSEFVTGMFAVEGRMRIEAGQAVNYVEHMRSIELAFIDRSDPEADHVIVIPGYRLREGEQISAPALPVNVTVVHAMRNSVLVDAARGENPATAGTGLIGVALPRPEVTGTDADQGIDMPAVYVALSRRDTGADLGTFLLTPWLRGTAVERQEITVDGRTFDLHLRFARSYKPYRVELLEFRHDKYVGTETPKNFSSLVRLVDDERGVDRTVKIWMNNPLRYSGETFYQSSFEPGRDLTVLQVVRNRGWMLPYLSCMIVAFGMSLHFGATLIAFLRRRAVS